jgi:catechol 2,3-dioxygenase-like lactoylglutathione lyase family enzyme
VRFDFMEGDPMNITLVLLCLTLPRLLMSGTQSDGSRETPVLEATGAFFALSVSDINASARWYSEKFGLKVVMPVSKDDKAAVTVLEGGGLIVELIQHNAAVPLSKAAPAIKEHILLHGLFKAGIIVHDFERTLEALKARHVEIAFGPFAARANQKANAIVRDNAGNLIQIFGR